MQSSNELGKTTCRTPLRGASRWGRWGTLGGVFCTFICCLGLSQTGPCFGVCANFDASDGDPCTVDTCEDVDGTATAVHTPEDCGDQVCNPDDGECVDCVVDADCAEGFCSELGGNICVECLNDTHCDDDNDCTDDACDTAQCTHTNVANGTACADENNECTDDACDDGVCEHSNVADGAACDDGSDCTENDACTAGVCGGSDIADCCESNDDCDTAAGETCNTTTNECETPTPDCTAANASTVCDDDDVCTDDTCVDGSCVNTNNTAGCDDSNFCTSGDVCANGACAGTAVTCPAGQACNPLNGNCAAITCTTNANCSDGFSCTADTCNLGTGLCEFTAIDSACNDGLFCNGTEGAGSCDTADPDTEAGTGCVRPGNPCVNPTPVCNEATNACAACTTNAQCDDDVPCTSDTCNTGTGACANVAVNASCPDPLKCDGDDQCVPADPDADSNGCIQPGNPCDAIGKVCSESTFVVGDLNTCTTCVSNADCSDGITCTQDVCAGAPALCSHVDTDSLCPDASFCDGDDVCDPADDDADATTGCTNGLEVAYPCAAAPSGACNENTNTCFACTSNADCNDGVTCTTDTCNGATGACSRIDNCAGLLNCNLHNGQCE